MTDFITELKDQILTITINRAEKRNTLSFPLMLELAGLISSANENDDVRCIVLTAEGDYFCSGYDISMGQEAFSAQTSPTGMDEQPAYILFNALCNSYKPLIAAVNGHAVGIGATMILPMDYRLVSEDANIGYVFTRRGVVQEFGSSHLLPRVVGLTRASDWILSGRYIDSKEALEAGLATRICKRGELISAAMSIAKDIVDNTSPVAVACARRLLWRHMSNPNLDQVFRSEGEIFLSLAFGPEGAEGIKSFLEKRLPEFPGLVSRDLPRAIFDQEKG